MGRRRVAVGGEVTSLPYITPMDHLSPKARSANMAKIRGADTGPELAVRRVLHAMGYRFRLHRRDLPGRPDIVLLRLRIVIFVHGCYWHRHSGCWRTTTPRTRTEFWEAKFAQTITRDKQQSDQLTEAGWRVLTVWECETRDRGALRQCLESLLANASLPNSNTDAAHQGSTLI